MNLPVYYNLEAVKPRPYQETAISYILLHKYIILADEMGLGKSLEALYAALRLGNRIFILCPAFLVDNWKAEVKKLTRYNTPIFHFKSEKDLENITEFHQILVGSYHSLNYLEDLMPTISTIIVDEAHSFKNLEAKRTARLHRLVKKYRPESLILLTGTPILNFHDELYSLFVLCGYEKGNRNGKKIQEEYPSYYSFLNAFCYLTKGKYGKYKILGARNTDHLKTYFEGKFLRRLSSEVLDLPALTFKNIKVNDAQDEKLEKAFALYNKNKNDKRIVTAKVASAVVKVNFTVDYIKDLLRSGQVLIFTEHIKSGELLKQKIKKLGYKVEFIYGEVPMEKRDTIINSFTDNNISVLIATIRTGSVGYNLVNCRNIVFNDHSFVPSENRQGIFRCHRIGQDKSVVVHNIYATTTDMRIQKSINAKQKVIQTVLD